MDLNVSFVANFNKEKRHSTDWVELGVFSLRATEKSSHTKVSFADWYNIQRTLKLMIMIGLILGLSDRHKAVGRIVGDAKGKLFDWQHGRVQSHRLIVLVPTTRTGLGVHRNAIEGFRFLAQVKPPVVLTSRQKIIHVRIVRSR